MSDYFHESMVAKMIAGTDYQQGYSVGFASGHKQGRTEVINEFVTAFIKDDCGEYKECQRIDDFCCIQCFKDRWLKEKENKLNIKEDYTMGTYIVDDVMFNFTGNEKISEVTDKQFVYSSDTLGRVQCILQLNKGNGCFIKSGFDLTNFKYLPYNWELVDSTTIFVKDCNKFTKDNLTALCDKLCSCFDKCVI